MSRQSKAAQKKVLATYVTQKHLLGDRAGADTQAKRRAVMGLKPHKNITQNRRESFATRPA